MTGVPHSLSVVVPAFNEEGVIGGTLAHLAERLATRPDLVRQVDVIVVSDGSSDRTFDEATEALRRTELDGTVVQLAKNVGSHTAIRCGLDRASGELVAVVSADGQESPDAVLELISQFAPDTEVVWGERATRSGDGVIRRSLARLWYGVFRRLTRLEFPPGGLDFLVMRRRVADVLRSHAERTASIFLLTFNLGLRQKLVPYEREERPGGTSKWSLAKRVKLAIDMVTGVSVAPIRMLSLVGSVVGLLGILFGGITVVRALAGDVGVPGWASLMVVTSLLGGLMLITLGLMGEYLWRALDEVRGRPLYLEARVESVAERGAGTGAFGE